MSGDDGSGDADAGDGVGAGKVEVVYFFALIGWSPDGTLEESMSQTSEGISSEAIVAS